MSDEFRRSFGAPTPPDRPQRGLLPKATTSRWGSADRRDPSAYQAPLERISSRPQPGEPPAWTIDDAVTEVIPTVGRVTPPSPAPNAGALPHGPNRSASRPAPPSRERQKRLIETWKWRATALAGLAFAGFWLLAFGHPIGSAAQPAAGGNGAQPAGGEQPANGAPGASPYFGGNGVNGNGNGNGGVFGGFGLGGGGGQGSVFSGRSS